MLDLSIIEDEIAALEEEGSTDYETCGMLSCLYSVRDEHMSALRAVYPAEFSAVMSRIRLLHDAHQAQD